MKKLFSPLGVGFMTTAGAAIFTWISGLWKPLLAQQWSIPSAVFILLVLVVGGLAVAWLIQWRGPGIKIGENGRSAGEALEGTKEFRSGAFLWEISPDFQRRYDTPVEYAEQPLSRWVTGPLCPECKYDVRDAALRGPECPNGHKFDLSEEEKEYVVDAVDRTLHPRELTGGLNRRDGFLELRKKVYREAQAKMRRGRRS